MKNLSTTNQVQQLFESGTVYLKQEDSAPVEIKREMTILTQDGQPAGRVAAVVLSNADQNVTHLLLTVWPGLSDYRLAPVDLIKQVTEETILLYLDRKELEHLPHRQEEE